MLLTHFSLKGERPVNSIKISKINANVYYDTLDNGLEVIVYKTPGFQKKMAFFQTRYGSLKNEFIPIGQTKMKSFPLGIAHFLEHKLFESKEKINYFEEFQNKGAYLNAATSYDKTYYYFVCSDNFYDNLTKLIDMVQTPYFTDENVEKEKGIIGQEIDMYSNNPNQTIYDKLYYNAFVKSPMKYDIAGTKKDIKKITKEDLYECYNTFYHPSNMFLVVVGDLDENEVFETIKKNQSSKRFEKPFKIVCKKYEEPSKVAKKEEVISHNVSATKFGYAYKMKIKELSDEKEDYKRRFAIKTFLRIKFGCLSGFTEYLIKNNLVKSYFNYSHEIGKDFVLIIFSSDILDEKKVKSLIDEKLLENIDMKKEFELFKKAAISNYVKTFESPDSICNHVRFMYNEYGKIIDDCYDIYSNITYDEFVSYIKGLDFNNQTKIMITKKEEV